MNDECASHASIKYIEGETTEIICECGRLARVTYKGARMADEEGGTE